MKALIRGLSYEYQLTTGTNARLVPWLMLHGFTGTQQTFSTNRKNMPHDTILTVDLVGHGGSFQSDISAERYQIQQQCLDLKLILEELKIPKVNLLGYSMGGRVALAFAEIYPEMVAQLVLESSSPGLKTEAERQQRRVSDENLAEKIIQNGVDSFVIEWESLPLFATQNNLNQATQKQIQEERLSQEAVGLAESLRQMGTGNQPSYWSELSRLNMPVYLLVGSLDNKFKKIAIEMNELIKNSELIEFQNAGHAIHIEKPQEFASILISISNQEDE